MRVFMVSSTRYTFIGTCMRMLMRHFSLHSATSITEVTDMWTLDFRHTESNAVSMTNSSMEMYTHSVIHA